MTTIPPPPRIFDDAPSVIACMKPACRDEVEFTFTRSDSKATVRLYACRNHTDMFQELALGVKYGNWESATIERFSTALQRKYLDELMRRSPGV